MPTLASLIGDRIFPQELPQDRHCDLPAIRYQIAAQTHESDLDGLAGIAEARFIYEILSDSYDEAFLIATLIKELVIGFYGEMKGKQVEGCELNSESDQEGTLTLNGQERWVFNRTLDFAIAYQEPIPVLAIDPGQSTGAIEESLYTFLGSIADVHPVAPISAAYPYIIYARADSVMDQDLEDVIDLDDVTFRFRIVSDSYDQTLEIADQIRFALEGATGLIDQSNVLDAQVTLERDAKQMRGMGTDETIFYSDCEWRIWHRPA
jgi:uncharacterized protein DUF3168